MDDGGASQPDDTVMSEAAAVPPPQHDPAAHPQHQPPPMGMENIPATLSHGGRFIQYNIFGNIFEVTAKYKPPIMPIGKGAYGIVWSMRSLFFSFCFVLFCSVNALEFCLRLCFCLLLLILGVRFDWSVLLSTPRRTSTWRSRRLLMRLTTRSMLRELFVRLSCFDTWIMKTSVSDYKICEMLFLPPVIVFYYLESWKRSNFFWTFKL